MNRIVDHEIEIRSKNRKGAKKRNERLSFIGNYL